MDEEIALFSPLEARRAFSMNPVNDPLDAPVSTTEQPNHPALTTRPAIEPTPPKKRRRLAYVKCDLCRGAKKKVSFVHVCCPLTQAVSNNWMCLV